MQRIPMLVRALPKVPFPEHIPQGVKVGQERISDACEGKRMRQRHVSSFCGEHGGDEAETNIEEHIPE